jgi:hypothetical protein
MDSNHQSRFQVLTNDILDYLIANNTDAEVLNLYLAQSIDYSCLQRTYFAKCQALVATAAAITARETPGPPPPAAMVFTDTINYFLLYLIASKSFELWKLWTSHPENLNANIRRIPPRDFDDDLASPPPINDNAPPINDNAPPIYAYTSLSVILVSQRALDTKIKELAADYANYSQHFNVKLVDLIDVTIEVCRGILPHPHIGAELCLMLRRISPQRDHQLACYQRVLASIHQGFEAPETFIEEILRLFPTRTATIDELIATGHSNSLIKLLARVGNRKLFRHLLHQVKAAGYTYATVLNILSHLPGTAVRAIYMLGEHQEPELSKRLVPLIAEVLDQPQPLTEVEAVQGLPGLANRWLNFPELRDYLYRFPWGNWSPILSHVGELFDTIELDRGVVLLESLAQTPFTNHCGVTRVIRSLVDRYWDTEGRRHLAVMIERLLNQIDYSGVHDFALEFGLPSEFFARILSQVQEQHLTNSCNNALTSSGDLIKSQTANRHVEGNVILALELYPMIVNRLAGCGHCNYPELVFSHEALREHHGPKLILDYYHRPEILKAFMVQRQHFDAELVVNIRELVEASEQPELLALINVD